MKKKINSIIEESPKYIIIFTVIIAIIFFLNTYKFKIDYITTCKEQISIYTLEKIFGEDNQDMLINLLSIITGFVITIISVFGIGYSNATVEIVEAKLDKKFSSIAKKIMFISILLLITIIFFYDIRKNEIIRFIMLDGLLYIILQFMVFGIIVFKMFEYNISESKSEYKQSEKQTNEIINLLKKIAGEEKINTGNYEECKKFNENMAKK